MDECKPLVPGRLERRCPPRHRRRSCLPAPRRRRRRRNTLASPRRGRPPLPQPPGRVWQTGRLLTVCLYAPVHHCRRCGAALHPSMYVYRFTPVRSPSANSQKASVRPCKPGGGVESAAVCRTAAHVVQPLTGHAVADGRAPAAAAAATANADARPGMAPLPPPPSPPPRIYMGILPEIKLHGHVLCRFECLTSMTLVQGGGVGGGPAGGGDAPLDSAARRHSGRAPGGLHSAAVRHLRHHRRNRQGICHILVPLPAQLGQCFPNITQLKPRRFCQLS